MGTIVVCVILAVVMAFALVSTARKATRGGGCCPEREAKEKRVKIQDKNRHHYPHSVVLRVDGMTCGNCVRRVENALNSMEGVWADEVLLAEGKVHVLSKSQPDTMTMKQRLNKAGYVVLQIL